MISVVLDVAVEEIQRLRSERPEIYDLDRAQLDGIVRALVSITAHVRERERRFVAFQMPAQKTDPTVP